MSLLSVVWFTAFYIASLYNFSSNILQSLFILFTIIILNISIALFTKLLNYLNINIPFITES